MQRCFFDLTLSFSSMIKFVIESRNIFPLFPVDTERLIFCMPVLLGDLDSTEFCVVLLSIGGCVV